MIKVLLSALVLSLSFSSVAFAQEETQPEGETKMKIEDAADQKNKVEGDIDQEITNARMRAESGSKSKLSLSTSIGYTGGSLDKPFGQKRPSLAGTPETQVTTSADIGLDARYRWTKNDSFTAGTSFGLYTPFQGDVNGAENQLNVFNPNIGYSRVGKVGLFQTTFGLTADAGTSEESKSIDYLSGLGISYNALYTFTNGLTVGTSVAGGYNFYESDPGAVTKAGKGTKKPGYYGGDTRTLWTVAVYPYAEYSFNDTFSARTVFGYFNWKHLYGDDNRYRLLQTFVYQSVGVGISVSRNIYLYPNIQFVPDNVRDDFTNVALSATINMF
ncbi:MAG: hypothetical protein HC883_05260 [Bdellovibrionaceae bacterium]|nr:hypothetical protein [Pseudobdellovibrionaceae bacterium]